MAARFPLLAVAGDQGELPQRHPILPERPDRSKLDVGRVADAKIGVLEIAVSRIIRLRRLPVSPAGLGFSR
jgi:hypothetical protein